MNDCDAHKAFTLLWSITDKIFDRVADIRNLLDRTTVSVTESSFDDPPPYENPVMLNLIDLLKQKINCLDDLQEQHKSIRDSYTTKRIDSEPGKNIHSEQKQQSSTSEHLIDKQKEEVSSHEDLNKQQKSVCDQDAKKGTESKGGKNVHSEQKQQLSLFEDFLALLKMKLSCLEDLDKQRRLVYDQYMEKRTESKAGKNVHSEQKQQVWNKECGFGYPDASARRDVFTTRRGIGMPVRPLAAQYEMRIAPPPRNNSTLTNRWYGIQRSTEARIIRGQSSDTNDSESDDDADYRYAPAESSLPISDSDSDAIFVC